MGHAMFRFIPLILANLRRRKLRTVFTLASIIVAFLLYGLLAAVKNGFEAGVELAGADRLITIHKVSLVQPLPSSYQARMVAVPGVSLVTHPRGSAADIQDERNVAADLPGGAGVVSGDVSRVPPAGADREARWLRIARACSSGAALRETSAGRSATASPSAPTSIARQGGSYTWDFVIDGIFDNRDPSGDTSSLLFHYDYFDEARTIGKGTVGWYIVRINDPDRATEVASAIDAQFSNSSGRNQDRHGKSFHPGLREANGRHRRDRHLDRRCRVLHDAARERQHHGAGRARAHERARGDEDARFQRWAVLALVLAESMVITLIGGALGTARRAVHRVRIGECGAERVSSAFILTGKALAVGVLLMMIAWPRVGRLPAARASRLRIADALRR